MQNRHGFCMCACGKRKNFDSNWDCTVLLTNDVVKQMCVCVTSEILWIIQLTQSVSASFFIVITLLLSFIQNFSISLFLMHSSVFDFGLRRTLSRDKIDCFQFLFIRKLFAWLCHHFDYILFQFGMIPFHFTFPYILRSKSTNRKYFYDIFSERESNLLSHSHFPMKKNRVFCCLDWCSSIHHHQSILLVDERNRNNDVEANNALQAIRTAFTNGNVFPLQFYYQRRRFPFSIWIVCPWFSEFLCVFVWAVIAVQYREQQKIRQNFSGAQSIWRTICSADERKKKTYWDMVWRLDFMISSSFV